MLEVISVFSRRNRLCYFRSSLVRSHACCLVCLFVCLFRCLVFARSVVGLFVRMCIRTFLYSFVLSSVNFLFASIAEVSTTQPESSSEEEEERPSSPGMPSESSDSDDEHGTIQYSLLCASLFLSCFVPLTTTCFISQFAFE